MRNNNMSRTAYDAVDAVNWSSLKVLEHSPQGYLAARNGQRTDSTAMAFGRLVHAAVLEPLTLSYYAVWPGERRGKAWQVFRDEHAGQEVVTDDDFVKAVAMADAVRSHEVAAGLLTGGHPEVSLAGCIQGVQCKGRLDYLRSNRIVDYKTTSKAIDPRGFARTCLQYRYHGQLAFYRALVNAETGEWLPVHMIAQQTFYPYEVACYKLPDDVLELGQSLVTELLHRLDHCKLNGFGSQYPGEMELSYPSYAYPDDSDGLEDCF